MPECLHARDLGALLELQEPQKQFLFKMMKTLLLLAQRDLDRAKSLLRLRASKISPCAQSFER